jgi:hypothetical protein
MRSRQAGKTRKIGTIGRSIAAARAALQRSLRVESLEGRWLMAADLVGVQDSQVSEVATWWSNGDQLGGQALAYGAGDSQQDDALLSGALQGEGEANQDLVGFAKALTSAGAKFYGAAWCNAATAANVFASNDEAPGRTVVLQHNAPTAAAT